MTDRRTALDRLYGLLDELDGCVGGKRQLAACTARSGWPQRGVYFFFEEGEVREDGTTARVVRVGTHGLRPSKSTLWKRLSQHQGHRGGTRPGGGNHRGSIFRLHVGTALLADQAWPDDIRRSWGRGSTPPRNAKDLEYPLERAVSAHIGRMPFLWVEVDDEPSAASERGVIEAGAIALLSNYERHPIDPPSPAWLGLRADREVVRRSGLWNVNHVKETPDDTFLEVLERRVRG